MNTWSEYFGAHRATLVKYLTLNGVSTGEGELVSMKDAIIAYYGDYNAERTRKVRAEADNAEYELQEKTGQLFKKSDVTDTITHFLSVARQTVEQQPISKKIKDKILDKFRNPYESTQKN